MRSTAQEAYFEQAAQTRAESDRDYRVWFVVHQLEQAARGDCTAWALSNAMASAAAPTRKTAGPISTAQRDELLSAVVRAQLGAIEHLPESYPREQIDAGMQALVGQVMVWAETHEQSMKRRPGALADIDAYARMFRNDMHNISLFEDIKQRAWERRASGEA
jgi:hypothetical protein